MLRAENGTPAQHDRFAVVFTRRVSPSAHAEDNSMMKAIFGLHVAGQTQLSLKAAGAISGPDPEMMISSRAGTSQRVTGKGEWRATLAAGAHIVQLEGDIVGSIEIDVSPAGVFVSLAGPNSTNL